MNRWWLKLTRYALPHWRGLAVLVVLILVNVALDLLKPWPLKLIIDGVLHPQPNHPLSPLWERFAAGRTPTSLLIWLASATVVLFLINWLVQMVQTYLQARLGGRMVYDLGAQVFDHLQRQSLAYHGRNRTGDLVRRVITDSGCIRTLMLWVILPAFSSIITLVAMFLTLWQLDRSLTFLALMVTPLLAVLIKLFAKRLSERTYEQQELEGQVMALAEQTLTALPVVQAFSREEYEDHRFRTLARRTVQAYLRATMSGVYFKLGTTAVTAAGTAVVMFVGGLHVLHGQLALGSLLVFLSYLASLYAPLETMSYLSGQLATAAAGARRVLEVLDADEGVKEKPGAVPLMLSKGVGEVRLEKVTFGYEAGRVVLDQVDLIARPGEVVALVGPTGAGKSTLVSLVPRFFDPWEGKVTVGGQDVRDLQLTSLRSQVSLVLQEPFLLPLTIRENIAYGRPGAGKAEVEAAAQAANAEEFIIKLPQGYETVLGERGASLSGGQRQRLSIARALLKDAPVLILDEPTSALDAGTERLVLGAMEKLMAGRTVLVIAHRLSTVRRANRIVVLDQGKVVEVGNHDQLVAVGGLYAKLAALQLTASVSELPDIPNLPGVLA